VNVGIDYDSNALYVCLYAGHDADPKIVAVDLRSRGGDQTDAILAVPTALAFAVQKLGVPTGTEAWIERGHGPNRNADWILGAIAGATLSAWPRCTGGGNARLIPAADWKKAVGAPGNGPKAVANHWTTLQWRSRHPGAEPPTNHNHLDAYAIALAGSTR
jgi:hypothetical protein